MDPILIGIVLFCASMIPFLFLAAKDSAALTRNRNTPIESAVIGLDKGRAIKLAEKYGYDVNICDDNTMSTDEYDKHRLNIRDQDGHITVAWIG